MLRPDVLSQPWDILEQCIINLGKSLTLCFSRLIADDPVYLILAASFYKKISLSTHWIGMHTYSTYTLLLLLLYCIIVAFFFFPHSFIPIKTIIILKTRNIFSFCSKHSQCYGGNNIYSIFTSLTHKWYSSYVVKCNQMSISGQRYLNISIVFFTSVLNQQMPVFLPERTTMG